MSALGFSERWPQLQSEVETCEQRLVMDFETIWGDLDALLRRALESLRSERSLSSAEPASLGSIEAFLNGSAQKLLLEVTDAVRKSRPVEKALQAMERYEAAADDVLRRAPSVVSTSGTEMAEALQEDGALPVKTRLLRLLHNSRQLPFRGTLQGQLERRLLLRSKLDGEYVRLLARACLAILGPWQDLRRDAIGALADEEAGAEGLEARHARWFNHVAELERQSAEILNRYRQWTNAIPSSLAGAMASSAFITSRPGSASAGEFRQRAIHYWSRTQHAIHAILDLEVELSQVTLEGTQAARGSLESLLAEQAGLLNELDSVISWLRGWEPGLGAESFPSPQARLVSAEDRASEWMRDMEDSARTRLPSSVEAIDPRHALPPRRSPWRTLQPRQAFLDVLEKQCANSVLIGFREAQNAHQAIVREIERAREVVAFSLETAAAGQGYEIAREGVENALSLTSHQRQTALDLVPLVERKLAEAIAVAIEATHHRLEQGRLGLLAQLARKSASDAMRQASALGLQAAAQSARHFQTAGNRRYHRVLCKIGWETPPSAVIAPVVTRAYLDQVLNLEQKPAELPMIYRRLFRLAPVEEARFLVGREAEIGALASARRFWETGHSVSVVLVGARGSGKTSLLNCAAAGEFAGAAIIRSQFSERITGAAGMRQFLCELLGLAHPDDLLQELTSRRRIIILEELERTFSRRMNGFEGIRDLAAIISATSRSTLWVVSLNQYAYRYLDAAVRLSQYFSHQINAMAVLPSHLKNAILLRHHLSGLRLQYPPLPESDPRLTRFQNLAGLHRDPEETFFDRLYSQSEGIFRTAFELWQQFIERVEGGVLYLKSPTELDYDPVISQLSSEDAFCLQGILQHGSLTEEEHSEIFSCAIAQSYVRINRLRALEFLEPDPQSPGFRVRPEAQRIVHVALHRLNLA